MSTIPLKLAIDRTGINTEIFMDYLRSNSLPYEEDDFGDILIDERILKNIFEEQFDIPYERMLPLAKAAEELGWDKRQIYYLIQKDDLPFPVYSFPGSTSKRARHYFDRADIEEYATRIRHAQLDLEPYIEKYGRRIIREAIM